MCTYSLIFSLAYHHEKTFNTYNFILPLKSKFNLSYIINVIAHSLSLL